MSEAYEKPKFYQNICEIRRKVFKLTEKLPGNRWKLINQMTDAARSAKQNTREGYAKDTSGEFARAIEISRGSLGELEGDIDGCLEDCFIAKEDYEFLKKLLQQTKYQMDRYLGSLYRLDKAGKWTSRLKK